MGAPPCSVKDPQPGIIDSDLTLRPSGLRDLCRASSFSTGPWARSYSEVSGLEGRIPAGSLPPDTTAPYDAPGTMGAWTTQVLTTDAAIVGVPTLDVTFTAPTVAATQAADPAGKLQVFAKLYDVAPDGSKTLVNKLISPVRVTDVTKSVHIELPDIVHRVVAGHRIQLVLASTDAAYKNAYFVQPVTITASPAASVTLRIPIVG